MVGLETCDDGKTLNSGCDSQCMNARFNFNCEGGNITSPTICVQLNSSKSVSVTSQTI